MTGPPFRWGPCLSGLLVCGICRMTMSGHDHKTWGKNARGYTCRRAYQGAPKGACNRKVSAADLEEAVWTKVVEWLNDPEALRSEMEDAPDIAWAERELNEIQSGLAGVEKGRANIVSGSEQGAVPMDEGLEALGCIKQWAEALKTRERPCHW